MKRLCLICIVCAVLFPLAAELTFSGLDLNPSNELLFSANVSIPGGTSYPVLFNYDLDKRTANQLTWYPESLELLDNGSVLQVRNRFGVIRYDTIKSNLKWFDAYTSFIKGATVTSGELPPFSPSPDGKWIVYWDSTSTAFGNLVLQDTITNKQVVLAEHVERCIGRPAVSWSAESSSFIYESAGKLYFARPAMFFESIIIEEKYRLIGEGTLSSIAWYSPTRFVYLRGEYIYDITAAQLFARSIYADLIGIGELVGKLSFDFKPAQDKFAISPNGKELVVIRDKRHVYYIQLDGDDYFSSASGFSRTSLYLPANTAETQIFWTGTTNPVIIASAVENGSLHSRGFRILQSDGELVPVTFSAISIPEGSVSFALSPDASRIAFISDGMLKVYDFAKMEQVFAYEDESVVSFVWATNSVIYAGGKETVRSIDIDKATSAILFFSSVEKYGWDETASSIMISCKTGNFVCGSDGKWVSSGDKKMRPSSLLNDSWRVFLDISGNDVYSNTVYLRRNAGVSNTVRLLPEPVEKFDPLPVVPVENTESVFCRGSSTRARQISLVFDALDNAEGLPSILYTLKRYNLMATFFINGEFIRRHPEGVKEIVKAGHQTCSMFFTTYNLNDTQFRIEEDFILRGLARNEDEFLDVTGTELSLFWHPAHYAQSDLIIESGEKAGYTYIGYDIDPMDWVTVEDGVFLSGAYYQTASQLVDRILAKKRPGSIIPIRVGKPEGTRFDYLYERLDLLISGLLENGYELIPVSDLIKNSR